MFSNVDYYLEKYDRITGRRDDTKDFIKEITKNSFSTFVAKSCEDINNYDFKTMILLEKILNDIPLEEDEKGQDTDIFLKFLEENNLINIQGNMIEVTKKGRALSRLDIDERYSGILYLILYKTNWSKILDDENFKISKIKSILTSIFYQKDEIVINVKELMKINQRDSLIEIASERFRLASIEAMIKGGTILDLCFIDMGLIELSASNGVLIYKATKLGKAIYKYIYKEMLYDIKNEIEFINQVVKNKKYDVAERKLFELLMIYGGNNVVWDYLAQIFMMNKKYQEAFTILKYAYDTSSKRGKTVKTILYHLVLVARKLKLEKELDFYETKLINMDKIN